MNDGIHSHLDGERPRGALAYDELLRLERLEQTLEAVALRVRAQPVPDLSARVMAALPREHAPSRWATLAALLRASVQGLWAPRQIAFQMRPAYGLGFAMAVLLISSVGPLAPRHVPAGSLAGADRPAHAAPAFVQFRLDAPGAARVELAGSFTDWNPSYALRETSPGVWTALVPVEPGVHDYLFVVDGEEWIPDPAAHQVQDDFGGVNSRLLIALPHTQT